MILLSKNNIIELNKATIQAHGGNYTPPNNLLNESNLDYLIDAIEAEMFGQPLYPKISDKAALYMFSIVCNHVFLDGNKRTGLLAATIFLRVNKLEISNKLADDEIYNFVIKVASGESSLEECQEWFKNNIAPI